MMSLKYGGAGPDDDDAMEGFSPVPPPLPRRQPVRNIYAEPFAADPRLAGVAAGGTMGGGHSPLAVFPLRAAQPSPAPVYSPSRFHIDKRCRHRCSWRCLSIAAICVCLVLGAALAYTLTLSSMKGNLDQSNCILVQDVKAITQAQGAAPFSSTQPALPDEWVSTTGTYTTAAPMSTPAWAPALQVREFDEPHAAVVPPAHFWSSEFRNKQPSYVTLNISLPWGANFGVYGRRNVAPSVTQYDWVEFVRGGRVEARVRRGADEARVDVSIVQYLDTGRWFLSLYNDELQPHRVELLVSAADGAALACPDDCSGHGACHMGRCECVDGYEGADCSRSVCPVLCAGHGAYAGGVCHCDEGWKGVECSVPAHDCEPADCSGRGRCVGGECRCSPGWKGARCDEEDCLDPTCGGRGSCVRGRCVCRAGWRGAACGERDARVQRCLPECSQRGVYDLEAGRCVCEPPYTGDDCSQAACALECGAHGACAEGACRCAEGWSGARCDARPCDPRCADHGQCRNGTCVCTQGWNGRHCTLAGCPAACSRHGQCLLEDGVYRCACADGWAGADCSVALELSCADNVDNDHDGMTDCSDSECCARAECADHIMCLASNDPVEVLLRKQPPSVTASFYQRVKFLIEENSVQSYAHMDEYSESRVSVMRGQVVSPQGLGIVGIRVSVDRDARFGFTLTRQGGWFDVLVNGGGAVTLQFQRSPFKPLRHTVYVPWNQIVVLPPVQMQLSDEGFRVATPRPLPAPPPSWWEAGATPCAAHDHEALRPELVGQESAHAAPPAPRAASVVFAEEQAVSEAFPLPGSGVRLTYRSTHAAGYLSVLRVRLTRAAPPPGLVLVHVRVEIEGALHAHTYEADAHLTHTFAWNKRNVYKQKVYGLAQARISVGYEYLSCAAPVWRALTATLAGFRVDISDVGGWGLDVHHHYNYHEGVLQKGDGAELHLKRFPRAVRVVAGTGLRRTLQCEKCEGAAADARLLSPLALAAGPDGAVYVGDFELVRRVSPDLTRVATVLRLGATQVAYHYYLCVSPADHHLYVADAERHQVLRVLSLEDVRDPSANWEPVVGSGERCVPGDPLACGDEGPARRAKLAFPKGLAIAADRTMYIADGTNIRAVDPAGVIHTLVGQHAHRGHWAPAPCRGAVPAADAQLQWPTGVALSPLDGSLHFIDDRLVLQLTPDMKIRVVFGQPAHCRDNQTADGGVAQVSAIAFAPSGDLYVSEVDARAVHSVTRVAPGGDAARVAGARDRCECNATEPCACAAATETLLADSARFHTISALAATPDGVLHVADRGSLHVLALQHYLPAHDDNGEFRIPYPPADEVYVFNRYGQHVATTHLASGKTRYSFLYSKNTSFGKLATVTDAAGNKIQFLRDYSNVVSSIESAHHHKLELNVSGVGFLTRLARPGAELRLDYDAGGLLTARHAADDAALYAYDALGRVVRVTHPTGERVSLTAEASGRALAVTVANPGGAVPRGRRLLLTGAGVDVDGNQVRAHANGSVAVRTTRGGALASGAGDTHPLLAAALPVEAEILRALTAHHAALGTRANTMRTQYSLVGDVRNPQQTLRQEVWVNGSRAVGVEFDQFKSRETLYDCDRRPLLTVAYDAAGLPLSVTPHAGAALNISYDRFNRVAGWRWGDAETTYAYDRRGLLAETKAADGTVAYRYDDAGRLARVTLASGRVFRFAYDTTGLTHVTLPSGANHTWDAQPSVGFARLAYAAPGAARRHLRHYAAGGELLQTVFPDGARVVHRYSAPGQLAEVVSGDSLTTLKYSAGGLPAEISHADRDVESRRELAHAGGLLAEERLDYNARTGLAGAKFLYEYDDNWRPTSVQGRVGGQALPAHRVTYDARTGAPETLGPFAVTRPLWNQTLVTDGIAAFARTLDERFRVKEVALTIHRVEVFRVELSYDRRGRVSQSRTHTRNVGVNSYTNTKNYTWDADGQLGGVDAQEPWGFRYDANGNMLALTYRGNTIPMQYNEQDRIVKFGEGQYRYDARGLVVQNAREERFQYSAAGLLVRATKRGRFDVRYYYDHAQRLAARKDNFGNVTQFFYTNPARPRELSHVYSPRDNRFLSLLYDDRGHLIYAQAGRHKYYVATDQCGTPVMLFNQYGEGIRELMRSPYGHIVYDSNPYLYLPVDFCGGLLDPVTSLVHMPNGKVYDPLIGQWMAPLWEDAFERAAKPQALHALHLYRYRGNDPVNPPDMDATHPGDQLEWLRLLGYDLRSLAPQLFPDRLARLAGVPDADTSSGVQVRSGFLAYAWDQRVPTAKTLTIPVLSALRVDALEGLSPGSTSEPPFGRGIVVSRTQSGRAIVSAAPAANAIYRDVYTSVLNGSHVLPFAFSVHAEQLDTFYFVKEEAWRAADDRQQLKRLQGKVNVTWHDEGATDARIHTRTSVVNVRYGTTPERERARLLHHARLAGVRRAWARERDALRAGLAGALDWSASELEEIHKAGAAAGYDGEYVRDPDRYPELAEDPYNVRFVKKRADQSRRRRRKRDACLAWWLSPDAC